MWTPISTSIYYKVSLSNVSRTVREDTTAYGDPTHAAATDVQKAQADGETSLWRMEIIRLSIQ